MQKHFLAILLLILPISSFAQTGLTQLEYKDEQRNRSISTFVFYPTNEAANQTVAENAAFYGLEVAENAAISQQNLPLYVLAHGTSGNWKNTSWLAKELAKNAVVVSANFPNYTTGQATPESVIKPWDQPKDVSFLIDTIFASEYGKHIDKAKVIVIGHSLGGYTAMALAGARIDLSLYQNFCTKHSDKSCRYFKNALESLSPEDIETAKQSLYDARVKAGIALTPGFTESMIPESLQQAKTPLLVISAEHDTSVPPETHLTTIPKNVEQYHVKDASHFSFLQTCKPKAKLILAGEGAAFVCEDGGEKSRAEIHQEALEQIQLFLRKHGM